MHRNLKPANIMVTDEGRVKVLSEPESSGLARDHMGCRRDGIGEAIYRDNFAATEND